jgi:hypothetical protein
VPNTTTEELRAARSVLADRRYRRLLLTTVKALVLSFIEEHEVRELAGPAARVRFRRHEGLEHVDRDLGVASLVVEKCQPRQLLSRRRGPKMHVSRVQIGCREHVETRLRRDPKLGPERQATAGLVDAERSRRTRQNGHSRHIDGKNPQAAQIEVLADLCHQPDAVQQRGRGISRGEARSACVGYGAARRHVRSEPDVTDKDQVGRAGWCVPVALASFMRFPVPHQPFSSSEFRRGFLIFLL